MTMTITEALEKLEQYYAGILEYPDPYRDPDSDMIETIIDYLKETLKK